MGDGVLHFGERRIHHQDEADGDRYGSRPYIKVVQQGNDPRKQVTGRDAHSHGREDPQCQKAVQERKAGNSLCICHIPLSAGGEGVETRRNCPILLNVPSGSQQGSRSRAARASFPSRSGPTGTSCFHGIRGDLPRMLLTDFVDEGDLLNAALHQNRITKSVAGKARVNNPGVRLDAGAPEILLKTRGFMHGCGLGQRDNQDTRKLRIAETGQQVSNRIRQIAYRTRHVAVIRFGCVQEKQPE